MSPNRQKNLPVVAGLVVVIGIMAALVSYSATLYRLFCAATGFGGTTQRAASDNGAVFDRVVTVRFDASIAPGLPWRFEPVQREVKVRLGEDKLVFFSAENLTDQAIVGHATFNVTPAKTGIYFKKIQCFCFDDERLDPQRPTHDGGVELDGRAVEIRRAARLDKYAEVRRLNHEVTGRRVARCHQVQLVDELATPPAGDRDSKAGIRVATLGADAIDLGQGLGRHRDHGRHSAILFVVN